MAKWRHGHALAGYEDAFETAMHSIQECINEILFRT